MSFSHFNTKIYHHCIKLLNEVICIINFLSDKLLKNDL